MAPRLSLAPPDHLHYLNALPESRTTRSSAFSDCICISDRRAPSCWTSTWASLSGPSGPFSAGPVPPSRASYSSMRSKRSPPAAQLLQTLIRVPSGKAVQCSFLLISSACDGNGRSVRSAMSMQYKILPIRNCLVFPQFAFALPSLCAYSRLLHLDTTSPHVPCHVPLRICSSWFKFPSLFRHIPCLELVS